MNTFFNKLGTWSAPAGRILMATIFNTVGRGQTVLDRRRRIKQKTLAERRRLYYKQKAA